MARFQLVSYLLPTADTTRRAQVGIVWNFVGGALMQAGTLLTWVVLGRVLGRSGLGGFAMVQSTVTALTALASLGLGLTATKYVSQYRNIDPARAGRILGLSSAVAAVAATAFSSILLAIASSLTIGGLPVSTIRLSAIYVFFMTLNGYQIGALAGMEAFPWIARIGLVYAPSMIVLNWTLAKTFKLPGAVVAQGLSALLLWLLYHWAVNSEAVKHTIVIRYRTSWKEHHALLNFSIPAILSATSGAAAMWWCNAQLVRVAGYSELGMFSAASTLRAVVVCVPAMNGRVLTPLLNNLSANGDVSGYWRTLWASITSHVALALIMGLILYAVGPQVMHSFGKDFTATPRLLALLLCGAVVEVLATNLYQALFATRSFWCQVAVIAVWVSTLVTISVRTIPGHGAVGLAFAYLGAWSVCAILYALLARRPRTSGLDDSQRHVGDIRNKYCYK